MVPNGETYEIPKDTDRENAIQALSIGAMNTFAVFLTLSKCKHLANLEPVKRSERTFTVALETSSPVIRSRKPE